MPIYEFICAKCDKPWDEMRTMDDYGDSVTFECPHCGEEQDKESRTNVGKGLQTIVNGTSKGNHNSGDYS